MWPGQCEQGGMDRLVKEQNGCGRVREANGDSLALLLCEMRYHGRILDGAMT